MEIRRRVEGVGDSVSRVSDSSPPRLASAQHVFGGARPEGDVRDSGERQGACLGDSPVPERHGRRHADDGRIAVASANLAKARSGSRG